MDHEGVFLAFLANVGCRELPEFLPLGPRQPSALELLGSQSTPRPPAAGNNDNWSLDIPHVIYKQEIQGKTY